ncbi:MAG: pilus assembly FimT family protein [Aureliella sp.]|jgi:type II secretory pathway pseudopilin PulG
MARRADEKPRSAFTLIEIVLVLAILVALGAMVAPSFNEAFLRQRLQSSADRLRSQWDRARLTAMKSGQSQVFACVLGTGDFSIEPYASSADILNASVAPTGMAAGGVGVGMSPMVAGAAPAVVPPAPVATEPLHLDEEITFVSCAVSSDMRAMTVAQAEGGMAAVGAMNQSVMFYPDGSTSTAEVIIQDVHGKQRAVRMRGLTGSTQVLTPGELPPVAAAPVGTAATTTQ